MWSLRRFRALPGLLLLAGLAGLTAAIVTRAAEENIPKGWKLAYTQAFDRPESLAEFNATDATAWKIFQQEGGTIGTTGTHETNGGGALELAKQSQYKPPFRSPVNIALLKGKPFGDFILEADLMQTGAEYGHRDMCLFFGFQSPSRYYYAHLATKADPNAHNIFIVHDQPRKNIAKTTTAGVNWGLNVWHKVRLERKTAEGLIKVYFDDMTLPVMVAEDKTFTAGLVGFGSFDDTGRIDNVRIWTPGTWAAESSAPAPFPPGK